MVTPLSLANLNNPPTAAEWFDTEIGIANTLGLPTTTWQPGGVERTIFSTWANVQQESDVAGSVMVQAGFLNFCATGYVTYTTADGSEVTQYVTPDPSNIAQNPTGALGWLDVLADSVYNVQRILSAPAGGQLALANTSVTTYGPFAAGTYHVAQTIGPTYANTASLTIPPSTTLGTVTGTSDSGGLVRLTVAGTWAVDDVVFVAGVGGTTEANGAWTVAATDGTTYIDLAGSVYANAYTSGGTVYAPTVAEFTADANGTASDADVNTVTITVTSLSGVTCANLDTWTGADTESNVDLAARCRLKLAALAVGQPGGALRYYALVSQQLGPTLSPPAPISAPITRARVDLDTTTGTVYVTIANASGGPGNEDVDNVQAVEDAYAGITANTVVVQAAVNHTITVALTVYLPAAFNTATNKTYFTTAVRDYIRALNIGGLTLPGGTSPSAHMVPYDSVLGSVYQAAKVAAIPVLQGDVQGTIEGGTSNVSLALTPVPEVAVDSVTVTLVSL